ncbi:MAG: trypsin-like peptidase domain-containing protein [Alphaproteobacteria bacterium]|nr:trypsin-like peptidase domain-containing protein [Alphaproteobacteria bacterium]
MPPPTNDQRVYIGHPKGASFRFRCRMTSCLIKGPPASAPSQPERRLIHYRAPTEPSSSGSPVFNEGAGLAGDRLARRRRRVCAQAQRPVRHPRRQ